MDAWSNTKSTRIQVKSYRKANWQFDGCKNELQNTCEKMKNIFPSVLIFAFNVDMKRLSWKNHSLPIMLFLLILIIRDNFHKICLLQIQNFVQTVKKVIKNWKLFNIQVILTCWMITLEYLTSSCSRWKNFSI